MIRRRVHYACSIRRVVFRYPVVLNYSRFPELYLVHIHLLSSVDRYCFRDNTPVSSMDSNYAAQTKRLPRQLLGCVCVCAYVARKGESLVCRGGGEQWWRILGVNYGNFKTFYFCHFFPPLMVLPVGSFG